MRWLLLTAAIFLTGCATTQPFAADRYEQPWQALSSDSTAINWTVTENASLVPAHQSDFEPTIGAPQSSLSPDIAPLPPKDVLKRIVYHHGQLIRDHAIAPTDHHVAETAQLELALALKSIPEAHGLVLFHPETRGGGRRSRGLVPARAWID